jgi:hypothetical protein
MRTRHLLSAGLAIGSIICAPIGASAGGWNCGRCDQYQASPATIYASPTYTYAQPTVTIVPRVIVQPNYVVERTYVVRPTEYLRDNGDCWSGCSEGFRIVNQGQYPAFETEPAYYESYRTYRHSGPFVRRYRAMPRSYFEMRRQGYRHGARHTVVWSGHQKQQTLPWPSRYRSR